MSLHYFAYTRGNIVTANADGRIPLNAKCGDPVDQACVEQANLAPVLLEALSDLLNASNPKAGVYTTATEAECERARSAIAKATSAARSGS